MQVEMHDLSTYLSSLKELALKFIDHCIAQTISLLLKASNRALKVAHVCQAIGPCNTCTLQRQLSSISGGKCQKAPCNSTGPYTGATRAAV